MGKIIIIILMVFVLFAVISLSTKPNKKIQIVQPQQANQASNVEINIVPKVVAVGEKPSFTVVFNTHVVNLDFDVTKSVYLVDDRGIIYRNSLWDGMPPGGHHRDGTLTFQTLLPKTKYIELVFINIAGVSERKFRWDL